MLRYVIGFWHKTVVSMLDRLHAVLQGDMLGPGIFLDSCAFLGISAFHWDRTKVTIFTTCQHKTCDPVTILLVRSKTTQTASPTALLLHISNSMNDNHVYHHLLKLMISDSVSGSIITVNKHSHCCSII